ncbi:MAG: ornithine cyclodeaminase family protein [Gemmatimonadetes bacterium]|nr:ornithine cyclodeaminase family protein [Gemmatimonadota bacterium]
MVPRSLRNRETLLLSGSEISQILGLEDYFDLVENAFRLYAEDKSLGTGLLHVDTENGEFHIKAGGLVTEKTYLGLKLNGGFFQNQKRFGLPNIQGIIVLCDGEDGSPLAIMESVQITINRTGATTAVAAKYLAKPDSKTVTICGCGTQGRVQLKSLIEVLPIERVFVVDADREKAGAFAIEMAEELQVEAVTVDSIGEGLETSDVLVTCTPSTSPLIEPENIPDGLFIAAVGADSPEKQELDVRILAQAKVVVDLIDQCKNVGELHHGIKAGVISEEEVHAELGQVIIGTRTGRTSDEEVIVFDATGSALQDTAGAIAVYERAVSSKHGNNFNFFS